MTLHNVINELRRREIVLYTQDGRLRYRAAPGALTPTLRSALEAHKTALIGWLSQSLQPDSAAITPARRDGVALPLSYAQQRLWFLDQFGLGGVAYNMPGALRLRGRLDIPALERSLNEILRRHDVLRTRFATENGQPVQIISPPQPLAIPRIDLSGLDETRRDAEVRRLAREEALRPFDLAASPLLRVSLLELGTADYVLLYTLHHIASDGWSEDILVREFAALYQAHTQARPSPLAELPIQYADFAVWQRNWLQGKVLERQLGYWRKQLQAAPDVLALPTDRPRPALQSYRGAGHAFTIAPDLTAQLHELSRREGATLFMTLLAAFQILLSRHSGQTDICVGSPIANRNRAEIEGLIGFFVNTLVLRTKLAGNPTFSELLGRVRGVCLDAQAHQDLPFEKLMEELHPQRNTSHSPLFQVMLVLQNAPARQLALPGLHISAAEADIETAKFDLTLLVRESAGQLDAVVEYATDLFDAATIARWAEHFQILLADIVARPQARLSELTMLPATERRMLLEDWNATALEHPAGLCLHQRFEAQAARTPEAVAVVCGGASLSYAELNARANRLARRLRTLGVGPEAVVGLCAGRSAAMVVGVLAVLKAGGAYLPLDPNYPAERLALMFDDAQPRALLAGAGLAGRLPEHPHTLPLDGDFAEESAEDLPPVAGPGNLAYLIYTSGSTGRPKGVAITHASASAFVAWALAAFLPEDTAAVLASTSLCFDLSVFELFVPLSRGGRVVVAADALALPGLADAGVTLVNTVPSAMAALLQTGGLPPSVRAVNLAGEALPGDLARKVIAEGCALYNLYGPSETTTYSTWIKVDAEDAAAPPIGRPVANTQVHLLDANLSLVPVGAAGEVYIGGAGLARGYLERPGLTAERFVPDPFGARGARLYKTGDLARHRADGVLEYLGRIDHQVKIRGFRVEPGEIEACLREHPGVKDAAVLARGQGGEARLVAYVTGRGELPQAAELRRHLEATLPAHMVPAAFVALDALPLTPNGKLDRKALPDPDFGAQAKPYAAPRNATEEKLASLWADVLGVERVGIDDDFFALGGHSLLAYQLMGLIRQTVCAELPYSAIFQASTVVELAGRIAGQRDAEESLIVTMGKGQADAPLYCFHPAGGLVYAYQRLADALQPGRSVYGLQSRNFFGKTGQDESIERLAEEYAGLIRGHSSGPYCLLGWSMGGLIALAAAQRLEALGERVAFVGLMDTLLRVPALEQRLSLDYFQRFLHEPAEQVAFAKLSAAERQTLEAILAESPTRQDGLAGIAGWGQARGYWLRDTPLEPLVAEFVEAEKGVAMTNTFHPGLIHAPLHVWWARDSLDSAGHPPVDWGQYSLGGIRQMTVMDGSHESIVRDAAVHRSVQRLLESALAAG